MAAKVTAEQAGQALHELMRETREERGETEPELPLQAEEAVEAEPAAPETPEEPAPAETPQEEPSDDVASLRKRLDDVEARHKEVEQRSEARMNAIQQRHQESERILRDRFLRKANVADRALKTLRSIKSTEGGIPADEVDRVIQEIEGTMNPASPSYTPPDVYRSAAEDQALILNNFLNEKGMTVGESEEFGKWIRSEAPTVMTPSEQAVAGQSIDGFLRLAHSRWQEGMRVQKPTRDDAVAAVRTVQRTQREAARAASAPAVAPRKQPTAPRTGVDVKALKSDDIAKLLRQSVDEAKRGNY